MTTLYVDYTNGNDTTGDGSTTTPYKTYSKAYTILGGNGNHTIKLKRGTIEPLSSSVAMRNGSSAFARSSLEAWYNSDGTDDTAQPRPILQASASNSFGLMWHLNGSTFKTIKNIVFDANYLAKYATQIYSGSTAIQDIRFENCVFKNTSLVSAADACNILSDTSYAGVFQIYFNNCEFLKGARHGSYAGYNSKVYYYKCSFHHNGLYDTAGGHGASSYGLVTTVTSGWTLSSGTIYTRSASGINHVTNNTNTQALKKNSTTPTTPGINEWGESGGTFYVNVNADPNGKTIKYSTYAPIVVYVDCTSYNNISIDGIEGTGFQADDFTGKSTFIRCIAYDNEGPGFFINQTANATLKHCLSINNGNFGLGAQYSENLNIINSTFLENCTANRSGYDADVKFQLGCLNTTMKNSIVKNTLSSIANRTIRFDSTSETNAALTNIYYFNKNVEATGTVSQTNVTNTNPVLDNFGQPLFNSTVVDNGVFVEYSKELLGVSSKNPPSIGAKAYKFSRGTR